MAFLSSPPSSSSSSTTTTTSSKPTPPVSPRQSPSETSSPPAITPPAPQSFVSSILSTRSRNQFSIFLAGASFLALSSLITRRSLRRRHLHTTPIPSFHTPSFVHPQSPFTISSTAGGAMDAVEALNIATINVASLAIMITGGLMWGFDISGVGELRVRLRGRLGLAGEGERNAEEEFEEWLASTLARRDGKKRERRGGGGGTDEE